MVNNRADRVARSRVFASVLVEDISADRHFLIGGNLNEGRGNITAYATYRDIEGITQSNRDYQRDYVLSLELIDVRGGGYDKESAMIRKGYHRTRLSKWRKYNIFTRG